jgi:hypothetical protein
MKTKMNTDSMSDESRNDGVHVVVVAVAVAGDDDNGVVTTVSLVSLVMKMMIVDYNLTVITEEEHDAQGGSSPMSPTWS